MSFRAAILSAVLLACACGPAPQPPGDDETLVVALRGGIDSFNPYVAEQAAAWDVLEQLYPRLVHERYGDRERPYEPWLADSWSFSEDRRKIRFHLRENARWTDGTPVTCDDVVFTYRMQLDDRLAWSGREIKRRLRSVRCAGEHEAVFTFDVPYQDQMLDANDDAIVPAVYGEVPPEAWRSTAWEERLVGCGPFRLARHVPGQETVLERNEAWWGPPARFARVVLRYFPDEDAAVGQLLSGGVQVVGKVPPHRTASIAARDDLTLLEMPSLSYAFIGWNVLDPAAYAADRRARGCDRGACEETVADIVGLQREHPHPILSDARVRRALTMAIDREDLARGLWSGHAQPGSSPIVSAQWAHDPGSALPHDPGAAMRLLEEAGWTDRDGDGVREKEGRPFQLEILVNADNRLRVEALERVAANLAGIGVDVTPRPLPRSEFIARARGKRFDAILAGWRAGTRIEPHAILHTRAALDRGNNLTAWSTPESDALLDGAAAAATREQAGPLWREWQRLFREQQPYSVLYEERFLVGLDARVQDADPTPLSLLHDLHLWHR